MAFDPAEVLESLLDAVVVVDAEGIIRRENAAARRLLGVEALQGRQLLEFVPSRFRAAHCEGFNRYVRAGHGRLPPGQPIEVSALRADGSEVMVDIRFGHIGTPGTEGFAVVGVLREATERLRLEREALLSRYLQAVVEAAPDGVLAWAPDLRILAVNRRFTEICRLPPEAIPVGGNVAELLGRYQQLLADPSRLTEALGRAREHPMDSQRLELTLADGRIVETYGAPITDAEGQFLGRVWYVHDATERRAAEAQRGRLLRELATAQRAHRFLLDASTVLARVSGFTESLQALARVAVPALGDICLVDVVSDDRRRIERVAAVHADPACQALVDELRGYPPNPSGDHPSADVLRDGATRWSPELDEEFLRRTTFDDRHFALVKQLHFAGYMTVPLDADGQVLGTITLVTCGDHRRITPEDVALAEDLGRRVALVVAKERRYEAQRRISHGLQANLLPHELPVFPGVEYAVCYQPGTRDAEVGGDFWDVNGMPDGEVAIMVGDVAGHDVAAAAVMAQLRAACRAIRTQTTGPDDLVRRLHEAWDQLGLERIATAVFARLRPESGLLRVSSAGHLPPLVVEGQDSWFIPVEPSPPFGTPGGGASSWRGVLRPGALVVFYTDGLVEDRHFDIDDGMRRLSDIVLAHAGEHPATLADHILAGLLGEERGDDVAVLVLRWLGPA
ncbi:MAG: SpoIIE family protein phosphatase [Acidothermus sp.]|nr:SpoIIE family protein phosphatase [Acidothermus sp.]MCL6537899.1 SpoIIE family protein phosphatase [Acidothermus sp.]